MTSTIVPPVDLAPGMPSRVVTISATDVTEGGKSLEGQMVRFALSDTLDVTSGGDVIAKTQAEVVLDSNGEGRIRLPVYDEGVKTWCGQDWAILVTATWGSQKAIRVPAGTSSIALSALPPVRPLRGREKLWAVTGASVTVSEGAVAGGSVSLNGGVLDLSLTIPRGDWKQPIITSGDVGDVQVEGIYRVHSASNTTGLPIAAVGVLEVLGSAYLTQRFTSWGQPSRVFLRRLSGGVWSAWAEQTWYKNEVTSSDDLNAFGDPNRMGAYRVTSVPANAPTNALGVFEALAMSNTTIQRYTTWETTPEVYVRSFANASSPRDWVKVGGDTSPPAPVAASSASGFKVIPLALTLGRPNLDAPVEGARRVPLRFAAPITRWRLHIRNSNPVSGAVRTGAVDITGLWLGESAGDGQYGVPPTQVHGAFTTPEDGSEWVSPWMNHRIDGDVERLISFGYSAPSAPFLLVGGSWRSDAPGDAASTSAVVARAATTPFDLWIEAETYATTPVVAVVGSSTDTGVGGELPVFNSSLSQYARTGHGLPVHYAHSGDSMATSASLDPSAHKWQRWHHLDHPDAVLFALGSNDVFGSSTLEQMKTHHGAVTQIIKDLISPVIYGANIFARTTATSSTREPFNDWLATLPDGMRDCFDFAAAIGDPVPPEWNADGIHLNDAGQAQLLAALNRPIMPAAPLYRT